MKRILMLLGIAVLMLAIACNQNASHEGEEGEGADSTAMAEPEEEPETVFPADSVSEDGLMSFHGLRINADNATAVSELPTMMEGQEVMENVKIAGIIEACCQKKGCWMEVKDENLETPLMVRFKDYGFFVPKDANGKKVVMEGRAFTDTISVEMRRHYAVDGGMSEEEAEKTITEPEVTLAFEATGVVIQSEE